MKRNFGKVRVATLSMVAVAAMWLTGCGNHSTQATESGTTSTSITTTETTSTAAEATATELMVQFGGSSFVLHLHDNDTAKAIARYVGTASWNLPIYHYDDYENWEVMQYYDIPSRYDIPSNPERVTSEAGGTVYYSEPNRIVLFYKDAEVPADYTPVGYFDFSEEFVTAVEENPVVPGWSNKIVNISVEN